MSRPLLLASVAGVFVLAAPLLACTAPEDDAVPAAASESPTPEQPAPTPTFTPEPTPTIAPTPACTKPFDKAALDSYEPDTAPAAEFLSSEALRQGWAITLVLEELVLSVEAHPDFGGLFQDNSTGLPVLVVQTVGTVAEMDAIVESCRAGGIVPIEVRQVQYRERDLRALQDRIASDWEGLTGSGIEVVGIAADPITNRVRVEVVDLTTQETNELTAEYGPMVLVEPGERHYFQ